MPDLVADIASAVMAFAACVCAVALADGKSAVLSSRAWAFLAAVMAFGFGVILARIALL